MPAFQAGVVALFSTPGWKPWSGTLKPFGPDGLTREEREAATRLLSRLMWMLSPSMADGEGSEGSDDDRTEPRIVNWVEAPRSS
jgi:hypothetical protein